MVPYRHSTTTRSHGIMLLTWAVIILAMCVFGFHVIWSAEPSFEKRLVPMLVVGPLVVASVYCLVMAISHILRPQEVWIEVDDEAISWRDWLGPKSMTEARYLLRHIQKIKEPSESIDCLIMWDGTSITLPAFIPNMRQFREAVATRARHIGFEKWDGSARVVKLPKDS